MRHGSLFSGIGGFDLAAEWAGWTNVFHCEWNAFGQQVLKHYWPEAESFGDITKTDFKKYYGTIDVISGGFPCQPYSAAGKRLGKEDDRHLWPEMLRAIREIQPRWVVGENVRGLVNWSGGLVFDEVQADLEDEGYEVCPFLLPAAGVGAPHRRDRIWFVAYASSQRRQQKPGSTPCNESSDEGRTEKHYYQHQCDEQNGLSPNPQGRGCRLCAAPNFGAPTGEEYTPSYSAKICAQQLSADANSRKCKAWLPLGEQPNETQEGTGLDDRLARYGYERITADADSDIRRKGRVYSPGREEAERYVGTRDALCYRSRAWENFPTQPPVCGGDDGVSTELDGAAIQDLLQGSKPREPWIPFAKWRNESIKAYGNAVVPQVVYEIFSAINEYESQA